MFGFKRTIKVVGRKVKVCTKCHKLYVDLIARAFRDGRGDLSDVMMPGESFCCGVEIKNNAK